ncbi:acetylcholinesterase isoform X1 [Mauremys mutica]|uniref:acetylcholinesterase isoform X1 n=1 Tax=Mauremys mutica TaxID=74926 RepID=UPI001D13B304|nr:acetylcholinesterase isoform X1 [Mauremys mutica]
MAVGLWVRSEGHRQRSVSVPTPSPVDPVSPGDVAKALGFRCHPVCAGIKGPFPSGSGRPLPAPWTPTPAARRARQQRRHGRGPGRPRSPALRRPGPRRPGRRAAGQHPGGAGAGPAGARPLGPGLRLPGHPVRRAARGPAALPPAGAQAGLERGAGRRRLPPGLPPVRGHPLPRLPRHGDVEPQPGDERGLPVPQPVGALPAAPQRHRAGLDLRRRLLQRRRLAGRLRRALPGPRRAGGGGLHELPGGGLRLPGPLGQPGGAGQRGAAGPAPGAAVGAGQHPLLRGQPPGGDHLRGERRGRLGGHAPALARQPPALPPRHPAERGAQRPLGHRGPGRGPAPGRPAGQAGGLPAGQRLGAGGLPAGQEPAGADRPGVAGAAPPERLPLLLRAGGRRGLLRRGARGPGGRRRLPGDPGAGGGGAGRGHLLPDLRGARLQQGQREPDQPGGLPGRGAHGGAPGQRPGGRGRGAAIHRLAGPGQPGEEPGGHGRHRGRPQRHLPRHPLRPAAGRAGRPRLLLLLRPPRLQHAVAPLDGGAPRLRDRVRLRPAPRPRPQLHGRGGRPQPPHDALLGQLRPHRGPQRGVGAGRALAPLHPAAAAVRAAEPAPPGCGAGAPGPGLRLLESLPAQAAQHH